MGLFLYIFEKDSNMIGRELTREMWRLDYNTNTVKHFIFEGVDEMSLTALRDPAGGWKWRGDHCHCGEYWIMTRDEVEQYEHTLSQLFHDAL